MSTSTGHCCSETQAAIMHEPALPARPANARLLEQSYDYFGKDSTNGIWVVWRARRRPSNIRGADLGQDLAAEMADRGFQHHPVRLVLGHPRPFAGVVHDGNRDRGRAKAPGRGPWGGPVPYTDRFSGGSYGSGSAALAGAYPTDDQPARPPDESGVQPAHHPAGGGKRRQASSRSSIPCCRGTQARARAIQSSTRRQKSS